MFISGNKLSNSKSFWLIVSDCQKKIHKIIKFHISDFFWFWNIYIFVNEIASELDPFLNVVEFFFYYTSYMYSLKEILIIL
jgi:hypothetical protein